MIRRILLLLCMCFLCAISVSAEEITTSELISEVEEFHSSLESESSIDSYSEPPVSSLPESSANSIDSDYLQEFKEYRKETTLTLQFILFFVCFACGGIICACVVRFIKHD